MLLSSVLFPLDWKPYWGRDDQSVLPLSPFLGFFVATSSGPRAFLEYDRHAVKVLWR